ncbi:hypothetical protein GCM10010423_70120 [Streptomyces levis]|uniref:Uncharacterized protein n=1 Tax=Streptomyces levis TaxID=285566 RepID=A0ABP6BD55_9ACTN
MSKTSAFNSCLWLAQLGPKVVMTSLERLRAILRVTSNGTFTLPQLSKIPRMGWPHALERVSLRADQLIGYACPVSDH